MSTELVSFGFWTLNNYYYYYYYYSANILRTIDLNHVSHQLKVKTHRFLKLFVLLYVDDIIIITEHERDLQTSFRRSTSILYMV